MSKLGVFGGSFDPVHYGHLLLAESAREQLGLDEVWFVPAAVSPHKQGREQTPARQRIEMLRLAIGGHPAFRVSTLEIDRGGVSYTVDTLEAIHRERSDAEIHLLLGADSLADLPIWRSPERICELALPIAVGRPGSPEPDYETLAPYMSAERLRLLRHKSVIMPLVGLSSSEIRARVAAGESIRYRTPRAVEKYLEEAGLYRGATS